MSGPQQIDVAYENLAELDGFAWDYGKAQNGVSVDVNRLVGFCLLIKREVIDAIGVLDERFGIGCYDDDDFCLRAVAAGFRAVIAGDAFVHHFGSRTFAGSGVDFVALLRQNYARFLEKWGGNGNGAAADGASANGDGPDPHPARHGGSATLLRGGSATFGHPIPASRARVEIAPPRVGPGPFAVDVAPEGGLRLRLDLARPKISLCMIVRDNARTIAPCLASIRPWVDEMIVVDTGSVDETPRIVESFGAKLYHFPWCDDFSAARNESLRHATGDWLFWMDSDDTIPPECGRGLRELVENQYDPSVIAYVMQVHCLGSLEEEQAGMGLEAVDHVKLFRNLPELRFDGRMHEQILTAINRMEEHVRIQATNLYVVHSGSDRSPAGQAKKLERDMRLLLMELAERPEHTFTLFNLGMTQLHLSRPADAADYLRRSLRAADSRDSHVKKAFALLALAEMQQRRYEEALAACRQGLKLQPHDVELRFREAGALKELGRLAEARDAYMALIDDRTTGAFQFSSVMFGMKGCLARQNLGVILKAMGDLAGAERQWREVVRELPRYRMGWRELGETLVLLHRLEDADQLAGELLTKPHLRVEGYLVKSRVALAKEQLAAARAALEMALAEHPGDLGTLRESSNFFFHHGTDEEAEKALRALLAREPADAGAYHSLGVVLMRNQRHEEAVAVYRQSLRYRPNFWPTFFNLSYALTDGGRLAEARAACEQAARLAPNEPGPRRELTRIARLAAGGHGS